MDNDSDAIVLQIAHGQGEQRIAALDAYGADSESKRICEVKRLLARFAVDILCHPRSWSNPRIST
jgi:hypothetical protein